MKHGTVKITFKDGRVTTYRKVTNLSVGDSWVFLKFDDGSRVQVPARDVQELTEDTEVYVRGNRLEELLTGADKNDSGDESRRND
jgi:hypothetical protein